MRVLKALAGGVSSPARWVVGQIRAVRGQEGASPYARLIALVTLVSLGMVVVFAVNLIHGYRRVYHVKLATAGKGGEYYEFGNALAEVINNNQRRIRVEVERTRGSYENMQKLQNGEVGLAIVQHDTPAEASVQAVASLFPEVLHLIVHRDIDSIPELSGKRIAVIPNLLGEKGDRNDPNSFFRRFIRCHGMESAVPIRGIQSVEDANSAFYGTEGADAIMLFIAIGNELVDHLLTQQQKPAKLLPINSHAIQTWHPYVASANIHKGAFQGEPPIPATDVPSVSVQALLLTHKGVDASIIREITRTLYDNRNELMAKNARSATMKLPNSGENLGIPLHPGAKAYYHREKPGFLVTYAEPLALFLSISVLCASGMWHLRLRLAQRQKDRADMYNLQILGLVEQVHKIEKLHELQEVRQQLLNIFRRVLTDLAEERISAESFQLFAFPWEMAIGAIRHREWALTSSPPNPTAPTRRSQNTRNE